MLAMAMVLSLAACGSNTNAAENNTNANANVAEDVKWPTGPVQFYTQAKAPAPVFNSTSLLNEWYTAHCEQPWVLNSEPAGGGIVALQTLMKAEPDGQTIMSIMGGLLVSYLTETTDINILDKKNVILLPSGSYTTREYGSLIVARADEPYNTWQEFVEYCKAHPKEVKWGTQDNGNAELKCLALIDHFGLDVNLLYGATAELTTNMLGKRLDVMISSPASALQYFETGEWKPLIMDLTEDYKGDNAVLAKIQTYKDLGIEDLLISPPAALAVPAGTPQSVIDKITAFVLSAEGDAALDASLKPLNVKTGGYKTQEEVYAAFESYYKQVQELIKKYF